MASETPSLLSEITEGVGNRLRTALTGKPPAGSLEDLNRKLGIIQATRALEEAQRDPNDPRKHELARQRIEQLQDIQLRGQERLIQMNDARLPTLLDARGERTRQDTEQKTQLDRVQTDNTLRAQGGTKRDFLGDITSQELKLADYDTATTQQVLDFYRQAQDKNLAAQEAARKPSLMKAASLLAGLGATAAALFG